MLAKGTREDLRYLTTHRQTSQERMRHKRTQSRQFIKNSMMEAMIQYRSLRFAKAKVRNFELFICLDKGTHSQVN